MTDNSNYSPEGRYQQPSSGFRLNNPTIVSLLYLGGFVTGISALIGLILAYVWNSDSPAEWERSHYRYHIRTFWLAVLQSIIGAVLLLLVIGWFILLWVTVWIAVRTIKALLAAQKQQPIYNPTTWLW